MTYSFTSVSHQTCTYHRAFPSAKADLGCWTLSAKLGFSMIGILRLRKSLLAECQESAFRDVEPLVPFRTHASLYPIPAIARPGTYLLPSQIRHCASYITFRPVPCVATLDSLGSIHTPATRASRTAVFNASRPRYPRGTLQDRHVTFDARVVHAQISTLARSTKRCRAVARLQFPRWGSSPRDFDIAR
jgi:hypothetical protein